MLDFYRSLGRGEKALVLAGVLATVAWVVVAGDSNDGIVAAAQVAAAVGTFILAGLAFAQVSEMRKSRIAQERPQVIVDTDHSRPPWVFIVVKNIGGGAARNVTFEFSAPIDAPEGQDNPFWVPISEQGLFAQGLSYLAPGTEITFFWGSMRTLPEFLRNRHLHNGITITTRYESLAGEFNETQWTVNPLLMADRLSVPQVGMKELVEEVRQLASDFNSVVSYNNREVQVSTASERLERGRQETDEEGGEQ